MAKKLNPNITFVKGVDEIPITTIPSEAGYFFYYDGEGKLNRSLLSNIYNMVEGVKGVLKIDSPIPTEPGKYELADVGEYTNLIPNIPVDSDTPTSTPITTSNGFYNAVYWDGVNFIQLRSSFIQSINDSGTFELKRSVDKTSSASERLHFPMKEGEKLRLDVSNVVKEGTGAANVEIKDSNNISLLVLSYDGTELSDKSLEIALPQNASFLEIYVNTVGGVTTFDSDVKLTYGTAIQAYKNKDDISLNKSMIDEVGTFVFDKHLDKSSTFIFRKNYPLKAGSKVVLSVSDVVKTGTGDYNVNVKDSNGENILVINNPTTGNVTAILTEDAEWVEMQLSFVGTITTFSANAEMRYGTAAEAFFNNQNIQILDNGKATKVDVDSFIFDASLDKGTVYVQQKNYPIKAGSAIALSVSNLLFAGTGDYNVHIQDSNGNYLVVKYGPHDQIVFAEAIANADWIKVQLGFAGTITFMNADVEVRYGTSAEALKGLTNVSNLETTTTAIPKYVADSYSVSGNIADWLYGTDVYFGYKKGVEKLSILKSVKVKLFGSTTAIVGQSFPFIICEVDQRLSILDDVPIFGIVESVNYEIVTFKFNEKIILKPKQTVFGKSKPISGSASLGLTPQTYDENNKLLTTSSINTSCVENNTMGATCYQVEVTEIDSIFATKIELEATKSQVATLQTALSKVKNPRDTVTGDVYEINITNGVVVPRSLEFKKIGVIGHSFVNYWNTPSQDWNMDDGESRAMAASVFKNQFTTMLQEAYSKPDNPTVLERRSGVEFEKHYSPTYDFATEFYLNDTFDCIIIYLCENAVYGPTMKASWIALLNYVKTTCPNAKIYCTGSWDYNEKMIAIQEACNEVAGVTYVDMLGLNTQESRWLKGDYYFGRSNQYYAMVDAFGHPNDYCFKLIADRFRIAMGQKIISGKDFSIALNQTSGGTISTPNTQWIKDGIVTIRTNPDSGKTITGLTVNKSGGGTVVATKRSNNKYNGTMKDYYTFTMPADNVTVTPTWT